MSAGLKQRMKVGGPFMVYPRANSPTIWINSQEAINRRVANNSTPANNAWPNANRALMFSFTIHLPFPMETFFVYNGNIVSGNLEIILLEDDGVTLKKLASTGVIAQAGVSVPQIISSQRLLPPGNYACGLALDNTTGVVSATSGSGVTPTLFGASGALQADLGALPFPATVTPVPYDTGILPVFGISQMVSF